MVHVRLGAGPALIRTVLYIEGFDGSVFDLRPMVIEVCAEAGGASGNGVCLDALEELFGTD